MTKNRSALNEVYVAITTARDISGDKTIVFDLYLAQRIWSKFQGSKNESQKTVINSLIDNSGIVLWRVLIIHLSRGAYEINVSNFSEIPAIREVLYLKSLKRLCYLSRDWKIWRTRGAYRGMSIISWSYVTLARAKKRAGRVPANWLISSSGNAIVMATRYDGYDAR